MVNDKKYTLLIDYNYKNINFTIIGNEDKKYESCYSACYELIKIVNILELNPNKYDNLEKIYEFIAKSINKKRIELKIENGKYSIIIQHFLDDELIESKIELSKINMNDKQIISLLNDKVKKYEETIKKLENRVQNQDERIKKLEENNAIYTIYLEKFNNLENQIKELKEEIYRGERNEDLNENKYKIIKTSKNTENKEIIKKNDEYDMTLYFETKIENEKIILVNQDFIKNLVI